MADNGTPPPAFPPLPAITTELYAALEACNAQLTEELGYLRDNIEPDPEDPEPAREMVGAVEAIVARGNAALAKAALYAAAPELYASLDEMVTAYWDDGAAADDQPEPIMRARAALASARHEPAPSPAAAGEGGPS